MNFLVVGCGSIGRRHARNLAATAKDGTIFVYDANPDAAAAAAKECGVTPLQSLGEARSKGIAGAVIAVPNHLHIPTALELMKQGSGVLIEKPLSHTMNGVDELLEMGRRKGLPVMTGYNLRYHPNIVSAKRRLQEGRLGKLLSARVHFGYNLALWRPQADYRKNYGAIRAQGGGVILDVIHEIDLITWLLGDAAEVACMANKLSSLEIDTEDVAAIILKMKNGMIVQLYLDYADLSYDRGFRIVGEKGSMSWDMPSATLKTYDPQAKTWAEEKVQFDFNETYLGELRDFIAAVRKEAKAPDDGASSKRDLEIALAAKRSAETGQFIRL